MLLIRPTANITRILINTLQQTLAVRMYLMECVRCVNTKRIVNIANGITSVEFVYVIPTRRISHRVFLFNLITALHVSGVVTTHPQEHTQISSNFSTIAVDNSTVKCLPDAEDAVALCS